MTDDAALETAVRSQMNDVRYFADAKSRLFTFFVDVDPVDNIERLTIFTDDGFGNGEEVFTINMESLEAGILKALQEKNGL